MSKKPENSGGCPSEFWDLLARHHRGVEDNFLDLASMRRFVKNIEQQPVLVVGAGQGLIVEELRKRGLQCDGVDLSSEMIKNFKHHTPATSCKFDRNQPARSRVFKLGITRPIP
jgi:2-polyprenyl-3-methyl-5-hydroxy-6-metoxy-1,4-benzoquinol methylase